MKCKRSLRGWTISCLTLLLGAAITQQAWSGNGTPPSNPGKYGELTALWWQWAIAQPAVDIGGTNSNPILDTTGAFASSGQEAGIGPGNKYFFLTGSFFDVPLDRAVTVPAGKALFFPIFNIERDNASDPVTHYTVPELRELAKENIDGVNAAELYAELDGQAVELFRVASPTFAYTLPTEDSLYDYFAQVGPQFEGTVKPVAADGYWAVIPPLRRGHHILQFGYTPYLNVTYQLTVE